MAILSVNVKKCEQIVELDFDSLPQVSKDYLIMYGLKQRLNDCHSQEKDPKKAWEIVQGVVAGLKSGEVKATRQATDKNLAHLLADVANCTLKVARANIEKHGAEVVKTKLMQKLGLSPEKLQEKIDLYKRQALAGDIDFL